MKKVIYIVISLLFSSCLVFDPLVPFTVETFVLEEDFYTVVLQNGEKKVITYPAGTDVIVRHMDGGKYEGTIHIAFVKEATDGICEGDCVDDETISDSFDLNGFHMGQGATVTLHKMTSGEEGFDDYPETIKLGDMYHNYYFS